MRIFNIKLFTAVLLLALQNCHPADSIKVHFSFYDTVAKSVSVAGSFNNWNPESHRLVKGVNGWELNVKLQPGYYYYKFVADSVWMPDPLNPMKINDGGSGFNSIIRVGSPPVPHRRKSIYPFPINEFPQPVFADNNDLVQLYYTALQMCWNKIGFGTKENGFADRYLDEGFNELIYQWDTSFMILFAIYANNILPAMPSLDNFYGRQRTDGYIQRVYWESDGRPAAEPDKDEPMINPPLFAWIEWRYYSVTGDSSRLPRVLPVLVKYFRWIDEHCKSEDGTNLYYTSMLGSGMDNTPRPGVNKAAWIDISLQQALAARYISKISEFTGDKVITAEFAKKYDELKQTINKFCWDEKSGYYYDRCQSGGLTHVKHIGAYWALLANVAEGGRADSLILHLRNPSEFSTMHMIPTLSVDDAAFDSAGHYWRGSVWAPTNYMAIKGLEEQGYQALADSIALNHLMNILRVYVAPTIDTNEVCYEDRFNDGYNTLWECYSPVFAKPATRWDNTFLSRQDFVGWTGLPPIALLIENILGLEIDGKDNTIIWRINRTDEHGIRNIHLKDNSISLLYCRDSTGGSITATAAKPFILKVFWRHKEFAFKVEPSGSKAIRLKLE